MDLTDFIDSLPPHKAALFITHNQYKNYYDSVELWISENDWCEWENDAAVQIAIETSEVWTIQWYPVTPCGFCGVGAPTLADAIRFAAT